MDGSTVSTVTQMLLNILLGCFCFVTLSWVLVSAQSFILDRKRDKREQEAAKREEEYHLERMKEIRK